MNMQRMVEKGFRAQLRTGNLLTGQLFVDLDFFPDAPPVEPSFRNGLPVVPSLPSSSQEIMQGVARFVKKLDQLPLETIGKDLQNTMAGMDRLVNGPDLRDAVKSLRDILDELENDDANTECRHRSPDQYGLGRDGNGSQRPGWLG